MPKRDDINVRLNKTKDMLTDRIVERVHHIEGVIGSPLGHYGRMAKGERFQLYDQFEESQGWGMAIDERNKLAGITTEGVDKDLIDFARQTKRERREGLDGDQG